MSLFTHPEYSQLIPSRCVGLLEISGKQYKLTSLPLRTVRPFVMGEITLADAAEEQDFDITDRIAVSKCLKQKVSSHDGSLVFPSNPCP